MNNELLTDFSTKLSAKINQIAKLSDANEDRVLIRIVGNYIEAYEIDCSEERVKCFLGSFLINEL